MKKFVIILLTILIGISLYVSSDSKGLNEGSYTILEIDSINHFYYLIFIKDTLGDTIVLQSKKSCENVNGKKLIIGMSYFLTLEMVIEMYLFSEGDTMSVQTNIDFITLEGRSNDGFTFRNTPCICGIHYIGCE